jgi:hypothetical protein
VSRLRKALAIILFIATSLSAWAQNPQNKPQTSPEAELERYRLEMAERARQEAEQKDWITRIFEIKYAQPYVLRQALSMFRATFNPDPNSRILAVRAPKEIMPAIEDALKRLDIPTPRRDAELTAYILMASDQPDTATLPSNLQPVIGELRKILMYKGYQLLDTLLTRGGEGRDISLAGALPPLISPGGNTTYQVAGRLGVDSDGKVPVLRISNLRFSLSAPGVQVGINTDVEIPQGQQIVVGKTTFVDRAVILVMSARFPN